MKLYLKCSDMRTLMKRAGRCVGSGRAIPILSHVLLDASDDTLTARATDFELAIETRVPATVTEPGAVTLPARPLAALVESLPDSEIALESGENSVVTISAMRSRYPFRGLPAEQYPQVPALKGDIAEVSLPGEALSRLIARVSYACLTDPARPLLSAALLRMDAGSVTMLATDTHRLVRATESPDSVTGEIPPVVIPSTALAEIGKLLGVGPVTLRVTAAQVEVRHGDSVLTTRLIDGEFPNFERVIPDRASCRDCVEFDVEVVTTLLKRLMSIVGDREVGRVCLTSLGADGMAQFSIAAGAVANECVEQFEAVCAGSEVIAHFNGHYALQHLGALGTERAVFRFQASRSSPFRLDAVGDDSQTHTIMPMAALGGG